MRTADYPDVAPDFGHWLAGFIDGEGCFTIGRAQTPSGTCYVCRFAIALRDDDEALLREIMLRVGCGDIDHVAARTVNSNPVAIWRTGAKADCFRIAAVLDEYPLRSKKARDYAIWREALQCWAKIRVGGAAVPRRQDWGRIAELREQLTKGREYRQSAQPRVGPIWAAEV